jgi:hypothetical protein
VFLTRRPDEPPNPNLSAWYRGLLTTVAQHEIRAGTWELLEPYGWPDNQSYRTVLAWTWHPDGEGDRHIVVINLADQPAQARIPLPWPNLTGHDWALTDLLQGTVFERDGNELIDPGLFVSLDPWQCHLLAVTS